MAAYLRQVLDYLSPTSDPSLHHFQELQAGVHEAMADNEQVTREQIGLQRKFQASYERICSENPRLVELMTQLRGVPLAEVPAIDPAEKAQQMAVLCQAVAFLQADKELAALKGQLDEIRAHNLQKEEQIAAIEAQLAEVERLTQQCQADIRARETNLLAVMTQRQQLQGK
jgi:hypothetical protein